MASDESCAARMVKKLKTETIRLILRDCEEPTDGTKDTLAAEAATQLLCETDSEEDDGY